MIRFALIGAGRIGMMHAQNIIENNNCKLITVYDANRENALKVSRLANCNIANTPEEAIKNNEVNAVFIASSTDTHVKFIIMAAQAEKPILCEKPIDLDINKVEECKEFLKKYNVQIQIGFNRRFDASNQRIKKGIDNGDIGKLEMIVITSRDPSPSTLEYHRTSGGLFRDCTIHDFDLSRYLLGNDKIVQINAFASQLFSDDIKSIDDHDTAMIQMKSRNGVLIHINNSRRAVYGYDQRLEVFGSKGMLISNNQTPNSVEIFNKNQTFAKDPILDFFIDRYDQAYKSQLNDFIIKVKNKENISVNFEDGRLALILANEAYRSLEEKRNIEINYE